MGEHPGTAVLFLMFLLGAFAGRAGGWTGALGGAAFMAVFVVPLYLAGAYSRAQLADQLSGRDVPRERREPHFNESKGSVD